MAYKKKSNRTSKPKKKYSAAEKRAYYIGVGVSTKEYNPWMHSYSMKDKLGFSDKEKASFS